MSEHDNESSRNSPRAGLNHSEGMHVIVEARCHGMSDRNVLQPPVGSLVTF
ncbi:MAG TPA: hypothetical protein VJJ78_03155 [Candidatus Saccharimonadales bacterium]|nr:hypothetical protein [Candidatus Saccharimonadales bacterium]